MGNDLTPQQKYDAMMKIPGMDPAVAQAVAFGSGSTNASLSGGPVYWETSPAYKTGHVKDSDLPSGGEFMYTPSNIVTKSQDEAMSWLANEAARNTPAYTKILDDMIAAGVAKPGDPLTKIMNVWASYLQVAAFAKPGSKMTPQDFLAADARLNSGGGPTVTHSRTVNTSSMSTADVSARAQNVATSALGRRLTPKEAAAYKSTANAVEAANPSVSNTTSTTNAAGTQQTNVTSSSGGASAAAIDEALLHQAMQNPEYGAYQAAGYYFPVLQQALGAVTGAGT